MTALRISAGLTLVGLALMVWSILVPTPLPVMLAMTVGQVIGTIAFGVFLVSVVRDVRPPAHPHEPQAQGVPAEPAK